MIVINTVNKRFPFFYVIPVRTTTVVLLDVFFETELLNVQYWHKVRPVELTI